VGLLFFVGQELGGQKAEEEKEKEKDKEEE
jgi:hypothetical protein